MRNINQILYGDQCKKYFTGSTAPLAPAARFLWHERRRAVCLWWLANLAFSRSYCLCGAEVLPRVCIMQIMKRCFKTRWSWWRKIRLYTAVAIQRYVRQIMRAVPQQNGLNPTLNNRTKKQVWWSCCLSVAEVSRRPRPPEVNKGTWWV